ncbi:DUF4868 domain-containing protein [Bacillus sp. V3-13]|uniref:Kiwa anti-phage protein KwaB-like domain-containing protein n=1 Tax=Bacillus sp. V3-13 TaxID=2053728 RepID=UPI000C77E218|nr:Kiwa anti-phage protein KwaB-like domain-containing protein [Bacillus sp. V3-13]PLR78334.1 DUF4868 domain-containing protein [Bacillus sp. V3-13]
MTIENIITKLEKLTDNANGKIVLYFTRKGYNGKYSSYKPGISPSLQKELLTIIIQALKGISGKSTVPFNPIGSLDETLETCDFSYVESLEHIIESHEEGNLLEDPPTDLSRFTFYCIKVNIEEGEDFLFFRRVTKFKKLKKGVIGTISTGDFRKIEADLIGIDGDVDIIGYDSVLTIANHISLERIFDIRTQYKESALKTLALIKETNMIENFEQFHDDSINDGRVIRGLTKLLKDPQKVIKCFENFDKVKELVEVVDLDINFSEDGTKIIYEKKEQLPSITLIIRDAYYQTYITDTLGIDELA